MSHRQKRKWPVPEADLILPMHFKVHHLMARSYHAEFTIEVPVKGGTDYFTIGVTRHTERAALRALIEKVETAHWFHYMRDHGVRFKVTGPLEATYRGYL